MVSRYLVLACLLLPMELFAQSDSTRLREHVVKLTSTKHFRTFNRRITLDSVASNIYSVFRTYTDSVKFQTFKVNGGTYKNVIASFGPTNGERIIIGAHYDVCGDQPGADDNASGVAGILELARLLQNTPSTYRIDLVTYALEEPPFFRSPAMGSFVHAQSLAKEKIAVKGMISLEMIGYFSSAKRSQRYPIGLMKMFYGGRGDYIAIVRKFSEGKFSRRFSREMKRKKLLRVKSFKGPRWLPGIDYSDHLNYWNTGVSSIMITDTSFYRNRNYHKSSDTIETLNFSMMSKVVDSVYRVVVGM